MPLQRMSDLLASTASVETKLQEAQRAADSFAELSSAAQAVGQKKKLLLGSKEKTVPISCLLLPLAHSSRRPKAISTIRQKKLAAREQLQALLHTLNMLDLELKLPEHGLHAADTANGEVRISSPDGCFLWNANTGHAVWDKILEDDLQDLRVVLSPDEGSSMFCCYAFLAGNGFRVGWCRDELQLGLFSDSQLASATFFFLIPLEVPTARGTSFPTISSAFCDAIQQLPASLLMYKQTTSAFARSPKCVYLEVSDTCKG